MPSCTQDAQKRVGTRRANAIANSIRIFRGLEGLAEVPYLSPLKPICGLVISILELVQVSVGRSTIKKLRDDHAELIDRISRLADILDPRKHENRAVIAEAGELERALNDIRGSLEAERQLSWFQRVRKTQELKENVLSCTAKLDAYIERLTVASLLRIHNLLVEDKDVDEVSSFPPYSPDSDSRVVIKRYHQSDIANQSYSSDVELLRRLRHPNLHQLLGISVSTAKTPFLVLPEFESGSVDDFINRRLGGSSVDSFMATLRVCQGIASGIEYLRRQFSELHQSELEACFQSSNIVLTPSGQPIVGHNLVLDVPKVTSKKSPQELDAWLKNKLLNFVNSITYGLLDLSDWNLLMARKEGRRTSHLRLLEHFTSYVVPNFTESSSLFDFLLERIEHTYRRNELTFKEIRSTAITLWSGAFVYRPKTPINCVLGDIGHMRADGEFVVLTNSSSMMKLEVVKEPQLVLRSAGGTTVEGSSDGSGIIAHQFGETLFASIRRRKVSEDFLSTRLAWINFISKAREICETFSTDEIPLSVTDLVFIVGVEEDLRVSIFDKKGNINATSCGVEFLEIENPVESSSWGEWRAEDGENACIMTTRCAQSLLFIQLEEEDIE
ncbi:hypothetical protein EYR40_003194 [Pleurotus pulmonarius]|nr:hypothetical protein EYR40_003194 [Pleurotus pulmonarius]